MCGIMYKVCTLENADLENEESYKSAASVQDIESTKESSCDERFIRKDKEEIHESKHKSF